MKIPAALVFFGLSVTPVCFGSVRQNLNAGFVSGFVTRAASATDFDVNGVRIECGNQTRTIIHAQKISEVKGCPLDPPFVGEGGTVTGALVMPEGSFEATKIELTQHLHDTVSGSGVVDRIVTPYSESVQAGGMVVRADGYRVLIRPRAAIILDPPLHLLADVKAGDWIHFEGPQRADGTVIAGKVNLRPLMVSKGEENFRAKRNFDPSKVPVSKKQSAASMYFLGVNPKRFPPYNDAEMQARIDEIGSKLVPAWQLALPDSDAAKIRFRFQLISTRKFRDALALSNGIILVPQQVVARMQNDSQLAGVLADNIATVLERQDYRNLPEARSIGAGVWAADAVGFFVPGVGLLAPALGYGGAGAMRIRAEDQSGRVALGLMHDAGYDIDQAPVAWWLLSPTKPKPISEIPLPHRAAYLYRILGECWNSPQAAAARHRGH